MKSQDCDDKRTPMPRASTAGLAGGGDLPLTCATPAEAEQYCGWLGATLPDEHQWLLAARGPAIHRYAWGDPPPSCLQHPLGLPVAKDTTGCARGKYEPLEVFAAGHHPAGAAPTGIQDVLLTPAELLRTTRDTISSACGGQPGTCAVTSLVPGAIDAAARIDVATHTNRAPTYPTFSFRCVWADG
jgi:hypothetical protein